MRGTGRQQGRSLAALLTCAALLALPAAAHASTPGPRLTEPEPELLDALACTGSLAHSPRLPVLLVHGTGVTSEENWSFGYAKVLADQGHSVCTVNLPDRGYGDVQRSLEYVVTAIREVHRRSGRRLAVIGHSQGAFLPPIAFRIWPDLAPMVEDFVGLSGLYANRVEICDQHSCIPAFWQADRRSRFWRAVLRQPLPNGPSYTAIGTLYDEIVKPQPQANQLPGGAGRRSVLIQDLCPGRRFADGYNHIYMAADAIAYDLATDALDHPGPADPARVPSSECAKQIYDGFDFARFATVAPALLTAPPGKQVGGEPPLRCYLDLGCPVLRDARLTRRATLRVSAADTGQLRVRIGRRLRGPFGLSTARRTIRLGTRGLRPGRHRVRLETRHLPGDPWRLEQTLRLRVLR